MTTNLLHSLLTRRFQDLIFYGMGETEPAGIRGNSLYCHYGEATFDFTIPSIRFTATVGLRSAGRRLEDIFTLSKRI
jgi:hypothetical protein